MMQGVGDNFAAGWVIGGCNNDNSGSTQGYSKKKPDADRKKGWFRQPPGAFSYSYSYMPQYPPPPEYPPPTASGGYYGGSRYRRPTGYYGQYAPSYQQGRYGMGHEYGRAYMNMEMPYEEKDNGTPNQGYGQHDMARHGHGHSYSGSQVNTTGFIAGGVTAGAATTNNGHGGQQYAATQNTGLTATTGNYHGQQGGYGFSHNYSASQENMEKREGGAINTGAPGSGQGQHDMAKHAHGHNYNGSQVNTVGFTAAGATAGAAATNNNGHGGQNYAGQQNTGLLAGGSYHGQQGGYGFSHNYSAGQENIEVRDGGIANKVAPVHGHGQQDMTKHAHGHNYGGTHVNTVGFTTGGATAAASANANGGHHCGVNKQNTGQSAGGGASASATAVYNSSQQQAHHDMAKCAPHNHNQAMATATAIASATAAV